METLKAILIQHDERSNLLNAFLCFVMTLALATVAFGIANLEIEFHTSPGGVYPEKTPVHFEPAPMGASRDYKLP